MNKKEQILYYLEDNCGVFISGEDLAQKCNVSRNMVWKYINALKSEGYSIISGSKGYSMSNNEGNLSEYSIKRNLKSKDFDIKIFDSVSSTNTLLKELAEKGAQEKTIIIANEQTKGRGRMGRSFYSPNETGIYMSILLRPEIEMTKSVYITTCAAVAVSNAIDKLFNLNTKIKWVNDIYVDNKKVCGILTEGSIDIERNLPNYIILGIGINLFTPKEGFPKDIKNIANSILNTNDKPKYYKSLLISEILNNFFSIYPDISNKKVYNQYKDKMFLIGKDIKVISNNDYFAKVLDVCDDYSLKIETENGKIKFLNSGEVSTKLKENEED